MKVKLKSIKIVAYNIKTFWFEPEKPVRYTAGQYIELFVPHDKPDERGQSHWYTLSSSPTEKLISITTKHAEGRSSTFKETLFQLKPGHELKIVLPMGDFVLPKDDKIPLVFVAGGIGITPFRSMLKYLADKAEKRDISVIYAAADSREFAFLDIIKQAGAKLYKIAKDISSEDSSLSAKKILELEPDDGQKLYYLSGPEPMVEVLDKDMKKAGVDPARLRTDFFPGYEAF